MGKSYESFMNHEVKNTYFYLPTVPKSYKSLQYFFELKDKKTNISTKKLHTITFSYNKL